MKESLGAFIKQKRLDMGLSQADVAKELGVTLQMIYRIEKGEHPPSLTVAMKLADILNFSPEEYFRFVRSEE